MNKQYCSICGGECSGKLELLVYTKLYPVCRNDWNNNINTPMKEQLKKIKKVSL